MDNKKVENKKHMSNKKKFWVGMSALAAVGIITATVAYFQLEHSFENRFETQNYAVTVKQLFDQDAASKIYAGKKIDANLSVENTGRDPLLVRVKYVAGSSDGNTITWRDDEVGLDLSGLNNNGWAVKFATDDNFERDNTDGYYYYKGLLDGEATASHLESLTLNAVDINGSVSYKAAKDGDEWTSEQMPYGSSFGEKATAESSANSVYIKAVVETIQATDANGNFLSKETVKDLPTTKTAWGVLKPTTSV